MTAHDTANHRARLVISASPGRRSGTRAPTVAQGLPSALVLGKTVRARGTVTDRDGMAPEPVLDLHLLAYEDADGGGDLVEFVVCHTDDLRRFLRNA